LHGLSTERGKRLSSAINAAGVAPRSIGWMEYQGKLGTGATVMVQDLIAATDNLWSETGPFRNPKTVSWLMACHPSAGFKIGVSIPAGYAT
jgi:hypothetical protein